MLAQTTSAEARRGIARNFALVMCKARFNSQIYREAKNEIVKLGYTPSHPHKGSKADRICNLIGFETFLRLRSLLRRLKLKKRKRDLMTPGTASLVKPIYRNSHK